MTVHRGEIYYIENNLVRFTTGSEQQGGRPGIIVSNEKCNEFSNVVEVVYLSTKTKTGKYMPTHVNVMASLPSVAKCEQIHSVDKIRLCEHIRDCTEEEMKEIDKALLISLGLDVAEAEDEKPLAIPVPAEKMVDLLKLEAEKNIYKNLYESLLDVVLFKKVTG